MSPIVIILVINAFLSSGVFGFILGNLTCIPPLFCLNFCKDGYETVNGCRTCRCQHPVTVTITTSTTATVAIPSTRRLTQLVSNYTKPCVHSPAKCTLYCEEYLIGDNGCQFCACAENTQKTLPPTIPTRTVVPLVNPCVPSETTCDKTCVHGLLIGPNNCQYCICSPYTQHITTAAPTPPPSFILPNACTKSQRCNLLCRNGYYHGPSGCLYCLCAPEHSTPVPTLSTYNLQPSSNMSEHCLIAIAICQVKCKSGFMTDTNDCTFCTCKSEIMQALRLTTEISPVIKLLKPCVQEYDMCDIFCAQGYLRGPDNCQFCACSH